MPFVPGSYPWNEHTERLSTEYLAKIDLRTDLSDRDKGELARMRKLVEEKRIGMRDMASLAYLAGGRSAL